MKIAERLRACVNAAPSNGNVVLTWQTADRLAKALADMDAEQENTRTLVESLQAEVERLEAELVPLRKLRDAPEWETIRQALAAKGETQ